MPYSPPASTAAVSKSETFTASGTWTRPTGVTGVRVTLCAGGGGGGGVNGASKYGGAGGGGEVLLSAPLAVSGDVTVTIGAGGAGGSSGPTSGTNGGTTTFAGDESFRAIGGKGGTANAAINTGAGLGGGFLTGAAGADVVATGEYVSGASGGNAGPNAGGESPDGSGGGAGSNTAGGGASYFGDGRGGPGDNANGMPSVDGYGGAGSGPYSTGAGYAGGAGKAGFCLVEWTA